MSDFLLIVNLFPCMDLSPVLTSILLMPFVFIQAKQKSDRMAFLFIRLLTSREEQQEKKGLNQTKGNKNMADIP